jgi:hypothetical protein
MYEQKGCIAFIDAPENRSEKFSKRTFGIEIEGHEFQQPMHFDCANEKMELLNSLKPGDTIKVGFSIQCRSWQSPEGKMLRFTSLRAHVIEKLDVLQTGNQGNVPPFIEEQN